jgi:lambda family phage tail tape measure protein
MSALSAANDEQLAITIVAKLGDLEKQMAKANGITARSYREMTLNSRKATKQMEDDAIRSTVRMNQAFASVSTKVGVFGKTMMSTLGTVGGGFAGGLIGGLAAGSLTQIVGNLGSIAKGIAEVGDKAKMAGLSTKAFQELAFVASQNRIEVDALADGMKELQLRADEWIKTGSGSGAESFQRLGFTAGELATRLKDPSALLVEIIRRVQQLDKAAQIRIFDELFGGQGGEKFVQLIDQGADGIARTIQQANDLGVVMSDEVITKAAEIDRKFDQIATTVSTRLKVGIIEVTEALSAFFDRLQDFQDQSTKRLSNRLAEIGSERIDIENKILALRAQDREGIGGAWGADNSQIISTLEDQMKALGAEEGTILDVLQKRSETAASAAKTATEPVKQLSNSLASTAGGAAQGANGLKTYADAVRALAAEIPGLAKGLVELDARTKIDAAYNAALSKARTLGEVYNANALRDQALKALAGKDATEAAGKGMLDLIGFTEGTDRGRGYNETLGYGKFTGGDKNLTMMTLDQIDALQGKMLANPENTFNSSALGRYQMTRTTLRGLRDQLGLKGTDTFDPAMQDRLAEELLRQRGNNPGALRKEWTSLQGVDDATIRGAFDKSSLSLGNMDAGLKEQKQTYDDIVKSARAYIDEQERQGETVGLTAEQVSKMNHEQEMLNELLAAGVNVTPEMAANISELAAQMSVAEVEAEKLRKAQEDLDYAAQEVKNATRDAMKGFVSDLIEGKSASEALSNALNSLGDKMLDIGLNYLLTGSASGQGSGGLLGSLFSGAGGFLSKLLGFADGGTFGPAGVVPFARGGVVNRPTLFPFANGTGLMGEAGPEAIMPLKRDRGGRLGVAAQGGGSGAMKVTSDVRVSVDNNGNLQAYVAKVSQQHVQSAAPSIIATSVRESGRRVVPTLAAHQAQKAGGDYRNG